MRVSGLAIYPVKGGAEAFAEDAWSRLRTQEGEPVFGVRYSVQRPGRVRVGDVVDALD